jgi:predicted nucleotidyltransferase
MNPEPNSDAACPRVESKVFRGLATPAEVTAALERHYQQIREIAGSALKCVALYGGVVRGRYQPQQSDINLLMVMEPMTSELLHRLAPVLRAAWREVRLEPFLLAGNELARAAVVFPTKMLDIRRFHRLLDGEDLLSGLEIRRQDLSLRLEQELLNLGLRLRRRFLSIEQDEQALQRVLLAAVIPLRVAFLALLDLAAAEVPGEERTATVYARAAERFKLDGPALERLSRLRATGSFEGEARGLYLSVLEVVARAEEIVTELGSGP